MREQMKTILYSATIILMVITTIYSAYHVVVGLMGFKKPKEFKKSTPKTKFAILIAARNEEKVIGDLIDSLKAQDYPADFYKIFVIPNNCTDATKVKALEHGAEVIDCTVPVRKKGDVLRFALCEIERDYDFDAYCVFDADNLADGKFLAEVNNAFCGGVNIVQGYRDSKNPEDGMTAGSHSIYLGAMNKFCFRARTACKISSLVVGTGFAFKKSILEKLGGFNTTSITEDLEFAVQCVLMGEKIVFLPKAKFYDEQPLGFKQSYIQRERWIYGTIQIFRMYGKKLLKYSVKERNGSAFDQLMLNAAPFMQVLGLITAVLGLFLMPYSLYTWAWLFIYISVSLLLSYCGVMLVGMLFTLMINKKSVWKLRKGILGFWVFMMSWGFICVGCFFKRDLRWTEIKHVKSVSLSQIVK